MNSSLNRFTINGPGGLIEVAVEMPDASPRGLAIISHPHPLHGGTMDNKVAQTLARVCVQLGYVAVRHNFRGVGATQGQHDEGRGETDDLLRVAEYFEGTLEPAEVIFGGFSFGTYVQARAAVRRAETACPVRRQILVGCAAGKWDLAPVPADSLVIHGESDDVIPLGAVFDWARPLDLPVVVVPGADHFFHRKLTVIKRIVIGGWHPAGQESQSVQPAKEY